MTTPSASVDLLDINVWLALADENHQHHRRACLFWEAESAARLAFCRVTMLGFLRLATNKKAMNGLPFSVQQAWLSYRSFRELPEVELLVEPSTLESILATWTNQPNFPVSHWTDSYLAALALSTGSRLVSFDSDFHRFNELSFLHLQ